MSETMFINPKHLVHESYCARGPVLNLMGAGGLAALVLPPLYKGLINILSTPIITLAREVHPYLSPEMLRPMPVWVFMFIGMLLVLIAIPQKRLWPMRAWWNASWDMLVGLPAFTAITWHIFRGAMDPTVAGSLVSILGMLPAGCLAYTIWRLAYWLSIEIMADASWKDTTQAVAHQIIRHMRIPKERVFLVTAEESGYTLHIRGSLSEVEVARLRMCLLMTLDYVANLEVFGSRASAYAQQTSLAEYASLARARRDAALAKIHRQKVTCGEQEPLPLPWHEKLFQHRYAGTVVICLAVIWATVIGFLVWLTGLFRPLGQSDLAIFFSSDSSERLQGISE